MISHHHKCVFIHIPKNAGQSIEHVFLNDLSLSWATRAPLLLRHNDRPELGPPKLAHLKWHEYVSCKYMTQEQFDGYYKFAFVRNPWARVVSMYRYFGFHNKCSFRDFVATHFKDRIWSEKQWFVGPQSDYICDPEGHPAVDFVGRVENLQNDFNLVCEKIGLTLTEVPHINSSRRRGTVNAASKSLLPWRRRKQNKFPRYATYQEYYDEETRDLVAELYKRDLELFGYEPLDCSLSG